MIIGVSAGPPVISAQQTPRRDAFKASGEHKSFEWFFLLVDAAREQDIWGKNGLDPEFVPAAASVAQLKAQVDAGVQVGWVNTAEVLLARSQGTPVKIVAGYFGETIAKIFTKADGPMRAAKDLDGKKVGVLSMAHTSYRGVLYMNEHLGIKAEAVPLGNLANNLAALKAGKVDAVYSAEGAALAAVDAGELRVLVPLADVYPKPYTAVVVWATDDVVQRNPDLVRRFTKATLETISYLKEHPGYASELYVRRTGAAKGLADRAVAELNRFLVSSGRGSGQDLIAAVSGNWRFTEDSGAVPAGTNVKVEEAVDVRFLP